MADYYDRIHRLLRVELPGIYDACDGCVHRAEGHCTGGGVCQLLHKFTDEAPIRLADIENELAKTHRPA